MARLKGSSLIEATVALTLLAVVMGVAWLTFEQLLTNNRTVQAYQAELLLRQRAVQIEQYPYDLSNSWDTLGYVVNHEIEAVQEVNGLAILKLQCESPHKRVFQFQQLIKYEP